MGMIMNSFERLLVPLCLAIAISCSDQHQEPVTDVDLNESEDVFIVVDPDGNIKLNHEPVTLGDLEAKLEESGSSLDSATTIIIQGDDDLRHRSRPKLP